MSKFKTFVLAAVLAVGGVTGAAVIDSPVLGAAKAAAADSGVKYFLTSTAAYDFAAQKKRQGYFTSVLSTSGGSYRVEWWSKH